MDGGNVLRLVDKKEKEKKIPLPPENLSFESKNAWFQAVESLFDKGLLEGANLDIFEMYCMAVGHARECEAMLAEDGKIINGKPHPAFKMMLDSFASAKNLYESLKSKKSEKLDNENDDEKDNDWKKDKGLLA